MLPGETFGQAGAERVVFTGDAGQRDPFNAAGTLAEWQQHIAAPAVGNSRAVFGLSLAFAAPCLGFLGLESGGVHLVGDSGGGKTTLLRIAASVYGGGDFALTWRATGNALEASAASRNDCLLALDEIGMTEAAEAGATVYSLMSGAQKGRLNSGAVLRARLSWRVLLLSTGELDLASHVAEGGKQVRAGQEARLVSLPADAGRGMGVWDELHGAASAAEFSEALGTAAARFHGSAGRAWLRRLVDEREAAADGIRSHVRELCEMWTSPGDSGQVRRVAVRFALAAAAGELAARWGIVPWEAGEAERAARRLLSEWITRRGGRDNSEPRQMLQAAAERLLSGLGNFQWATRAADDHSAAKPRTWGVRRLLKSDGAAVESDSAYGAAFGQKISAAEADETSSELLIFTTAFRAEIAKGFDAGRMARVLFERGHLRPEDVAGKRLDRKERLPGLAGGSGGARVYVILPSLFDDAWLASA